MNRTQRRHRTPGTGQSAVELALLLPFLVVFVLAAVDFSQVVSIQQRLDRATHQAATMLLHHPAQNSPASLSAYIQAESQLPFPVSAIGTYHLAADGADQVVITATYSYPLLTPGLRNLQTHSITDGKLHIAVQAAGVAATDPPTIATVSPTGPTIQVIAPSGTTVPTGLTLRCTLYQSGVPQTSYPCHAPAPLMATPGVPYSGTVTQANGVTSPPSTPVTYP